MGKFSAELCPVFIHLTHAVAYKNEVEVSSRGSLSSLLDPGSQAVLGNKGVAWLGLVVSDTCMRPFDLLVWRLRRGKP